MKIPVVLNGWDLFRAKPLDDVLQLKGLGLLMTFEPSVELFNRVVGELLEDDFAERMMAASGTELLVLGGYEQLVADLNKPVEGVQAGVRAHREVLQLLRVEVVEALRAGEALFH